MTATGQDSGRRAPLDRLLGRAEYLVARRIEAVVATDGLTIDQWRVLDLLSDGGGHTMSGIAAAVGVPSPTLTKLVDRLVDTARVYRLADARDRRRVLVFLSDEGHAVHTRLSPAVRDVEADVLGGVGGDAPALLDLLDQLVSGG
ncbi:MarR family winged helix-turn-helix transcriptional regulator [Pseudonocardia broussonetiae]|uniref:MarR family transcriptional regulator n=1 Tax=Pseudonocardia broussonetiae TaxID=2736640 RepID=A0A6M6JRP0_9PSEU|nr:MarR family transcriptional regulator [Pseudonocardia broussonetiae]QJY49302.1 MarR family transcriptional regulator [Pseudonocardia broussonetiae]